MWFWGCDNLGDVEAFPLPRPLIHILHLQSRSFIQTVTTDRTTRRQDDKTTRQQDKKSTDKTVGHLPTNSAKQKQQSLQTSEAEHSTKIHVF
ncbi:hypothetical protein F2P81_004011 [Scophthalmus maximus]|uniref:Uncharacterized protein n=1 Tax=Scophthalmus maximus TaxID=52904 RepID=A0A6A4THF6_SCOMX|nr:hypothetical protein F2P81_004011 [Scophthalmus maximus]